MKWKAPLPPFRLVHGVMWLIAVIGYGFATISAIGIHMFSPQISPWFALVPVYGIGQAMWEYGLVLTIPTLLMFAGFFFFWRWLYRSYQHRARSKAFLIACLLSYPVVTVTLFWQASLPFMQYDYERDKLSKVSVSNYSEELVHRKGIESPIGVRIQFDLDMGEPFTRSMEAPRIWMSPSEIPTVNPRALIGHALTKTENAQTQHFDYLFAPDNLHDPLGKENDELCVYQGKRMVGVDMDHCKRLSFGRQECIAQSFVVGRTLYTHDGNDLNSAWPGMEPSPPGLNKMITRLLREHSKLQGDEKLWHSMFAGIDPGTALVPKGWEQCKKQRLPAELRCYCRP